jgi:hypothetical protein
MPAAIFDGPSLTITMPTVATYSAKADFYSDWKEWVKLGDNAKYPPAFETLGGDPISGTENVAPYFFLRNDLGWRIKVPESDGEVTIDGNLFPRATNLPTFIPSLGAFTVMVRLSVSSRAIAVTAGGGGLTSTQDARLLLIEKLLRNKLITNPATGTMTLYDDDGSTVLLSGNIFEDAAGGTPYAGNGAERRERLT